MPLFQVYEIARTWHSGVSQTALSTVKARDIASAVKKARDKYPGKALRVADAELVIQITPKEQAQPAVSSS